MNRLQSAVAISALLITALPVHATITMGALSRQFADTPNEDSSNNRQWLGWDVTRGLNCTQTLAATQSGGAFEGFRVARSADAVLFVNAMVGVFNGSASGLSALCVQTENRDFERLVGETLYDCRSLFNGNYDYDGAWFLAGGIEIVTQDAGADRISINHRKHSIAGVDANLDRDTSPAGWLLFRDAPTSVPRPVTLALAALALLAACTTRRQQPRATTPQG